MEQVQGRSDTSDNESHVTAAASSSTSPPDALLGLYEQVVADVTAAVLARLETVPSTATSDPWLTVQQVAEQVQLSEKSVLRALSSGTMEGAKRKGRWRVRQSAVDKWMDSPSEGATAAAKVERAVRPTMKDLVRANREATA